MNTMRTLMRITCMVFLSLFFAGNSLFAQEENAEATSSDLKTPNDNAFFGFGAGLDYGGIIGIKLEYLPVKHLGIFGGLGYNLAIISGNVGLAYKILPDNKTCPNIIAFYGCNGSFKGEDSYASQYDMNSYGLTLGVSLDIITGQKGNKLSLGLLFPIRSQKFMDNYDKAKNDPNLEIKGELIPIGISVGYNFRLSK